MLSLVFPSRSRSLPAGGLLRPSSLVAFALLLPTLLASAAEPDRPFTDIFAPLSRPAELIHHSAIVVMLVCLGIFLVVMFMLCYVLFKFPSKGPDDDKKEPPQIYGSSQIELAWTIIPILITVVLILVTVRTIVEIQDHDLPPDTVHVRIIGHQFWWEIHYLKPDGVDENGKTKYVTDFITANELHIPVSRKDKPRPTALQLESADVIHSYWVPQLNGKTDLIPNHTNRMWLEPYETGTYFGNCAEYCGTQHANMLIRVMVQTSEEFDQWAARQRTVPAPPTDALAVAGYGVFHNYSCVNCHKVDGSPEPLAIFGPDLTHFASRRWLGSGVALNNTENLLSWMRDPHVLKPGVLMPNMQLTETEVEQVTAYLQTLK